MYNIKRLFFIISILGTIILLNGCIKRVNSTEDIQLFEVKGYDIIFSMPGNWRENICANEEIDMQCNDGNSYMITFAYNKTDLAKNQVPKDIYDFHTNDIMTKRDNIVIDNKENMRKIGGKTIISNFFTGEINGNKNCYYINLVDFGEKSDKFVCVLFTAKPSYGEKKIKEWDKILEDSYLNI